MESYLSYFCQHADQTHWIIFGLLLLSGLNFPISEDLLILGGGAIASTCIPDHALRLYIWIFFGSLMSAWEAYWLGRLLGPKLFSIPFLRTVVTTNRLEMLRNYYAKFGVFTFIVGRFIPGGMRNALFISSGLTKMPFLIFVMRDSLACLISTAFLFNIGYRFGENFDLIAHYFRHYTHAVLALLILLIVGWGLSYWYKKYRQKN